MSTSNNSYLFYNEKQNTMLTEQNNVSLLVLSFR